MAWENSAWKCILSQDDGAIHEMKNIKALQALVEDDYLETLLLSLRPQPPHFSEVAIFGKGIKGVVGRLRLDPFARLLYSSNPEDFRAITSLLKQGVTLQDAIEEVASRQEKGDKK
jgi:conjugal transfer ATP-binding protein TraC